jgi:microcompartment protein CcmL/EutN
LAQGLGGKAYFIITGEIHAVQESTDHVHEASEPGMLTNIEVIPAPHDGLKNAIGGRLA